MRKLNVIPVAFLMVTALVSLNGCKSKSPELIGGQKDKHGCLVAAGYTWSEVRKDCIRVFEDGTRLNNIIDKAATTSAFVVFSKDNQHAELFLPDSKSKNPILQKTGDGWQDKMYKLVKSGNTLRLYKNTTEIYRSGE